MPKYLGSKYSVSWMDRIASVDQAAWDMLAAPLKTPFLEWDWLHLMEASGSITPGTGWEPQHLTVWSGRRLVAAAPLYLKHHSAGEFVYDNAWADLATRLGIGYYPKLVGMSPVTPVAGYRFLIDPQADGQRLTDLMVREIDRFCRLNQISGCSFLFVDPAWRLRMAAYDFSGWLHQSYAWQNRDFRSFEDYLAIFNANQRHNIRRERRKVQDSGIRIEPISGDDIPRSFLPLMYRFYVRTNDRYGPWSCKYLSKTFFDALYDRYRHRLVLMTAYDQQNQGLPVAMSLLLIKGELLFGRYWGSFNTIDALHFDACYYRPIEWAISRGIQYFDPGVGSYHKLRRGFEAVPSFSLHKFYDPRLQLVLQSHINAINRLEHHQIDAMNAQLPFAKTTLKNYP
ncbi:MAG: GNAT family N-acetyltransferase [Proteobacteria bacterium]|nr:GNAT family N-acetyltransferase [Pseudomonadota bacterium]